jgi:hypothetical protein
MWRPFFHIRRIFSFKNDIKGVQYEIISFDLGFWIHLCCALHVFMYLCSVFSHVFYWTCIFIHFRRMLVGSDDQSPEFRSFRRKSRIGHGNMDCFLWYNRQFGINFNCIDRAKGFHFYRHIDFYCGFSILSELCRCIYRRKPFKELILHYFFMNSEKQMSF